jgi:starch synthase (maltosyl-transferring)
MKKPEKTIIYNLFPLLAGKFTGWEKHFKRISSMGFNWVYVNPVQRPGKSGSLYSIAEHQDLNPFFVDDTIRKNSRRQLSDAVKKAEKMGLLMMTDLVINHCAADSRLLESHPDWFEWEAPGKPVHPFADENGKKVVWTDLARFNFNTGDQEGLHKYFLGVVKFLYDAGFKGFRCDAAYQVPRRIWERLIRESKKLGSDIRFFAETLGCTPDQTVQTAQAGFDYIFNSSKWWDFSSNWLLDQYNMTRNFVSSISFPESHDTVRLSEELQGNVNGLKQRYLFAALFSAGVMMPIGYEFGFRKRMHVVQSRPEDWEKTSIDLRPFITKVNKLKARLSILQQDTVTEFISDSNQNILLMRKTSPDEALLLIVNKDAANRQQIHINDLSRLIKPDTKPLVDLSPENPMDLVPMDFKYDLEPGQGIVLAELKRESAREAEAKSKAA